jgi:hypothetical protein
VNEETREKVERILNEKSLSISNIQKEISNDIKNLEIIKR